MNNTGKNRTDNDYTKIPPIFIELLKDRGIEGETAIQNFLFPRLVDLPQPARMQNLAAAARLVVDYIRAGKQIIIWGDYDVDGTTGTSLLVNFFIKINVEVSWHIPNRLTEGYGLNSEWFDGDTQEEIGEDFLLITVDCGISDIYPIEIIKKKGGKVIVTDHHALAEDAIPDCLIVNPSQQDCGFNGEHLAGVGVAFYLAAAIKAELCLDAKLYKVAEQLNLKQFLAFVALGTIADIVEMTQTNRILVRAGLEALSSTPFVGLRELLTSCDIMDAITSEDIGFYIGPKINAAGRLGKSQIVVNLLTEQNQKKARRLAKKLTKLNLKRRMISNENLEITLQYLSNTLVKQNKCAIVKGDLHPGVVGIVASRLVDIYGYPAIVFAEIKEDNGEIIYTGSARSIDSINILELLQHCSRWLKKFGGHAMAAGLTVSKDNFKGFEADFVSCINKQLSKVQVKTKKKYDLQCPVATLMTDKHLNFIHLLGPFGPGNPQPIFMDPAAKIVDSRAVGRDGKHLQLTLRGEFSNLKGIAFNLGEEMDDIQKVPTRFMIYAPTINRFRGNISWQVRVIEI